MTCCACDKKPSSSVRRTHTWNGHDKCVRALTDAGADVNHAANDGCAPPWCTQLKAGTKGVSWHRLRRARPLRSNVAYNDNPFRPSGFFFFRPPGIKPHPSAPPREQKKIPKRCFACSRNFHVPIFREHECCDLRHDPSVSQAVYFQSSGVVVDLAGSPAECKSTWSSKTSGPPLRSVRRLRSCGAGTRACRGVRRRRLRAVHAD